MKPDTWSAAVSHIETIDRATGVQRTILLDEALTAALTRWDFSPLVIDNGQIQRNDTLSEDLRFMELSMQDKESKHGREIIDRALCIHTSAPKS